ncbi:Stk1 family PASTA domain-containing Ser/Thr kinase [Thermomonospora catenispora]|uniref:Stk1 family PASTA domain-containing Ser/Thr kinase n=1 Tax=Thermomonospora catenispora TaxID=2493090 RepID=UPI00111EB06C|nr:Stk1 family PASTA domain-containing Ser/Thr kinase [Thermomonospora catenispora]TNY37776.1 Stk1 family PASTA domain-containing Ser/Thr kinase [Thermomonospora catenispora]
MTQPRLLGGRYELDSVVGRGGMAEVYRAKDLRLDRIVAVKTLRSDLARDPIFQARFSREAQSAASLNHPSVIAVYDTGEDQVGDTSIPYIVMEYVEGQTLRDLLREQGRLAPERALEITDGILRALDYSHRGGIIHRDIKPANVMLTRNHEVKVMDFGIARAMADTAATMTQTAQVIGTAQYLSPEQARGERVDARSDLYSTGCVLYELLTGQPPFTGDSPVAIAYQHVREEPVPPSRMDPAIPQWCDNIVLKAMAKDPAHRYQTAAEFRADIQRAMQGMPVAANAASTMLMDNAAQGTRVMSPAPGGPGGPPPHARPRRPPRDDDYDLPPVEYDEEDDRRGGKGKQIAIWALVVAVFIGGAALIGVALSRGTGPSGGASNSPSASVQAVEVPDVEGKRREEAEKALTDAGLKVGEVTEEYSDEVAKGRVISTDPAAGEQVATGESVNLVVSKGKEPPQKALVPDVTGQPAESARQTLEQAGFKVSQRSTPSNDVEKGLVVRTTPGPGQEAAQGSTVVMYVSSGPQNITVPNVVGQTESQADTTLRTAGLDVRVVPVPPQHPAQEGKVVRQSVPPGQQVAPGTTVTIFVAQRADGGGDDDGPEFPFPGRN